MVSAGGVRQEGEAADQVSPVGTWSFVLLGHSGDSEEPWNHHPSRDGAGVFTCLVPLVLVEDAGWGGWLTFLRRGL